MPARACVRCMIQRLRQTLQKGERRTNCRRAVHVRAHDTGQARCRVNLFTTVSRLVCSARSSRQPRETAQYSNSSNTQSDTKSRTCDRAHELEFQTSWQLVAFRWSNVILVESSGRNSSGDILFLTHVSGVGSWTEIFSLTLIENHESTTLSEGIAHTDSRRITHLHTTTRTRRCTQLPLERTCVYVYTYDVCMTTHS